MEAVEQGIEEKIWVVIVVFFIALGTLLAAYVLGFFRPLPKNEKHYPLPIKYLIAPFLIFLGTQSIVSSILAHFWSRLGGGDLGWIHAIATVITATALFGYFFCLPSNIRRQIWNNGKKVYVHRDILNFFFGVLVWFAAYPLVVLVSQSISLALYYFFGATTIDQEVVKVLEKSTPNTVLFGVLAVITTLFAPAIEELLFRGFLQTRFKNSMGIWPAIILTAIIFALFHFTINQGLSNFEFIAALFVFACFLGYVYERQNSLWAPIGLHAAFNGFSILLIALAE